MPVLEVQNYTQLTAIQKYTVQKSTRQNLEYVTKNNEVSNRS